MVFMSSGERPLAGEDVGLQVSHSTLKYDTNKIFKRGVGGGGELGLGLGVE